MCVIIAKKPGIEIPYEMLNTACGINRDGWGASIADRGQLTYRREYKNNGNDATEITKFLEDARDLPVMLHLRFATSGQKGEDNCHPFTILEKQKHGSDLTFAHNGTLNDFIDKTSTLCDSWHFNNEIVTPLVLRCAAFTENVLDDPLLAKILKEYAGYGSVFSLMNGDGDYLIINKDRGKEFEFGWASNEYSFKRHKSYHSEFSSKRGIVPFVPIKKETPKPPQQLTMPPAVFKGENDNETLINKECSVGIDFYRRKLAQIEKESKVCFIPGPSERDTFVSLMGITTLDDLQYLSTDDLLELTKKHPRVAALAIIDLLADRLGEYAQ